MTLADQKLDTMPAGNPVSVLGADSTGKPVLFTPTIILGRSAVPVSVPDDTTEDIVATVTIPAGLMGINGRLRITALWSVTNSGNTKTMRTRFGGIGGTIYQTVGVTTVATVANQHMLANRGAANSQVGGASGQNGFGYTSSSAVVTSAIDTTAAVDIVFTGQKASAGETITLESYMVELIP